MAFRSSENGGAKGRFDLKQLPSKENSGSASVVTKKNKTTLKYDPNTNYVSLVIGDGDNIAYKLGSHADWMIKRVKNCGGNSTSNSKTNQNSETLSSEGGQNYTQCFPIVWSTAPALMDVSPGVLQWYFLDNMGFDILLDIM